MARRPAARRRREFGTTGIVLTADRTHLLVAQQSSAGLGARNPSTGKLYRIEIGADGKPGTFEQLWESGPADGPDGFAIDRDGNVYITLLVANQIAVIAPDGTEIERFPTGFGGRQRLGGPVRQPLERDVPRPPPDRRQPGLPDRRHDP